MTDLFQQKKASEDETPKQEQPQAAPVKPVAAPPQNSTPSSTAAKNNSYDASDIEVLEGLEPVRHRPGMYIGGTDERAYHHLAAEILDNSMDEAVAGHADRITLTLHLDGSISVQDNGRGIPIDPHPKFPDKSALEVILTTLHSGGKFSNKAYETSGGLHGVGMSVVNALSDELTVTVTRNGQAYVQNYSRGHALGPIRAEKAASGMPKNGTLIRFHPDPEIFGNSLHFKAQTLFQMARSKAYLHRGLTIVWQWEKDTSEAVAEAADQPAEISNENIDGDEDAVEAVEQKVNPNAIPDAKIFRFANGLADYLDSELEGQPRLTPDTFSGNLVFGGKAGKIDFALAFLYHPDGWTKSYCNTVPTPLGGTHENGFRNAILKSLRHFAELKNIKRVSIVTADDIQAHMSALVSVFIPQPLFQGQTKERLASTEATRLVETAVKDHFDHWLAAQPDVATALLQAFIDHAEARERQREEKSLSRKTATRRLRLPGKLADCSRSAAEGTELFLVEGDSAGGSAKQARRRDTQAILPLRGKILNVASASADKIRGNQEIQDMILAMGCGVGKECKTENLRYEKIIIMTDADVDGAHISSLLIAFFYTQMRPLIAKGHLYLAQPPLYRLTVGNESVYAMNDAHKDEIVAAKFKNRKVEVSRFKGLGEMPAKQLKETTMDPASRTLIRVTLEIGEKMASTAAIADDGTDFIAPVDQAKELDDLVDRLMGKNPEARFTFIQENAPSIRDIDI